MLTPDALYSLYTFQKETIEAVGLEIYLQLVEAGRAEMPRNAEEEQAHNNCEEYYKVTIDPFLKMFREENQAGQQLSSQSSPRLFQAGAQVDSPKLEERNDSPNLTAKNHYTR